MLAFELDELGVFGGLDGEVGGLITPDDVARAAAGLEPDTSAALLIWEDLWALEFTAAVRDSGGVLLEGGRIPHDLVQSAFADLPAAI